MRDKRKDYTYFKTYCQKRCDKLAKRENQLASTDDPARQTAIKQILLLPAMELLIASFSAGADSDQLKPLLLRTCRYMASYPSLNTEQLLFATSLAVLLDDPEPVRILMEHSPKKYEQDKLLHGFASWLMDGRAQWSGRITSPKRYGPLDKVITAESPLKAEDFLMEYLVKWEKLNKDEIRDQPADSNFYYGYWSFEAAALARILDFDLLRLACSDYFPIL